MEKLLGMLDEPNRSACMRLSADHRERFETAYGSSHNHQAWPGGYLNHVTEVMNIALILHRGLSATGRPMPPLSSALLVLFLHDLEKPWRFEAGAGGATVELAGLKAKADKKAFRDRKLAEYGIVLSPEERNAMNYVEGEGGDDRSDRRVSGPLAAFCHLCDTWSARGWHDYPLADGDPWPSASRFRSRRGAGT
jgi:hypothetical protein